jgi:hypothetical protein
MSITLIRCGNVTASSADVENNSVISAWLEVEEYFKLNKVIFGEHSLELALDSKPIRDKLTLLNPENIDAYLEHYYHSTETESLSQHKIFSGEFSIDIRNEPSNKEWDNNIFIKNFIEQLFLAMNISRRGGCNYGSLSIDKNESKSSLHCDDIESGWHLAEKDNWPKLNEIPFAKTWKWMEENNGLSYILADTPVTKAMAVLLHQSYKSDIESTDVVQLSRVLESFYLKKEEPKTRGLINKIPVVLGKIPSNGKRWINEFYKLRSDIVHGDFPLFRPKYGETDENFSVVEEHYWKISQAVDRGVSVILATLQDLILRDANTYKFKETIIVDSSTSG